MLKILGIDPGTATTGYSFVKGYPKLELDVVKWGVIETDKNDHPGKRLSVIFNELDYLVRKFKPDCVSMEKVFFASNAKTAIRVGQAQGIIIYVSEINSIPLFEYSPMSVKKIVAGSGRADKKAVQEALRTMFGPKLRHEKNKKTHFDDAMDAIALAYTHAYHVENKLI